MEDVVLLTYIVPRLGLRNKEKPVMRGNIGVSCLVRSTNLCVFIPFEQKKTGLAPGELNREVSRLGDVRILQTLIGRAYRTNERFYILLYL